MDADEVWNSVRVCGPQSEIERLKRLCHLPDMQAPTKGVVADFSELMPHSCWGREYYSWNGVTHSPYEPDIFSFGFDCGGEAPVEIFERLAEEFPSLSFACSCIGSMDEFMASGWFNGPSGSEEFTFQDVPADYWGRPEEEDEDPS